MGVYFSVLENFVNNCISKLCLFTSHPIGGWMCDDVKHLEYRRLD